MSETFDPASFGWACMASHTTYLSPSGPGENQESEDTLFLTLTSGLQAFDPRNLGLMQELYNHFFFPWTPRRVRAWVGNNYRDYVPGFIVRGQSFGIHPQRAPYIDRVMIENGLGYSSPLIYQNRERVVAHVFDEYTDRPRIFMCVGCDRPEVKGRLEKALVKLGGIPLKM